MRLTRKLWIGIFIVALLSPLGYLLPELLKAGAAWGEWGIEELRSLVGYIPQRLAKLDGLWKAPIPDYIFKGWEEKGLGERAAAYAASALGGIVVVALVTLITGWLLVRRKRG